jgi:VanZ family protein
MTDVRYRSLWWVLGVVLVVIVLVLSVLPNNALPTQGFNDKINHMLAYVAMTGWFCGLVLRARWWRVAVALSLVGIAVEIAQSLMPFGREGDAVDLIANTLGIGIGWLLARFGLADWPSWVERLAPTGGSRP